MSLCIHCVCISLYVSLCLDIRVRMGVCFFTRRINKNVLKLALGLIVGGSNRKFLISLQIGTKE